jgi:hypothetical protein
LLTYENKQDTYLSRDVLKLSITVVSPSLPGEQPLHAFGFTGEGRQFSLQGVLRRSPNHEHNRDLVFSLRYPGRATCYYEGSIGNPLDSESISVTLDFGYSPNQKQGAAVLSRLSSGILRFRPPPSSLDPKNCSRARSLWAFAVSTILTQIGRQLWTWRYFREFCNTRRRFIYLIRRHSFGGRPLSSEQERDLLAFRQTIAPADRMLFMVLVRRDLEQIPLHM